MPTTPQSFVHPSERIHASDFGAFPNPVRGRLNAAFFTLIDGYMHWKYRRLKRRLFSTLQHVSLELGQAREPISVITPQVRRRWVLGPWRWLFERCHTHRDTVHLLERAGFWHVAIRPFTRRSVSVPVRPQIAVVCTK